MSLLPGLTQSAPGAPLYAPVSGGGGGGSVSTFTTASISSLSVSSINGALPGGAIPPNLTLSTLAAASWLNVANQNGGSNNFRMESQNAQKFNLHVINGVANPGIQLDDAGVVSITNADFQVSSINGALPGGAVPPNLTLSTLTVSSFATMLTGGINTPYVYTQGPTSTITLQNNYAVAGGSAVFAFPNSTEASLGFTVGASSNGMSIVADAPGSYISALGNFALSNVSSLNGAGVPTVSNKSYPFTTGSDNTGSWYLNVDSNTGGLPQYLTAPATTSSSHTYLVSCDVISGSNGDTTQTSYTKLALALSGAPNDVTLRTYSGLNNFWIYNGQAGSVSALVRGASAIRLYATNTSPNQSTLMVFDTNTGLSISDLGPSS